jgi:UDP-N-acetylenolpyruvoylglucosamine reductase
MAIRFNYRESTLSEGLSAMAGNFAGVVLKYADTQAKVLESKMKRERRWKDRTGNAKAGLTGSYFMKNEHIVTIALSHQVKYGIWLELAKEKKYAVIMPTINRYSPEVIENLKGILITLAVKRTMRK